MTPCEPSILSAYLDGELDPAARKRVEAHLRECPTCAEQLRTIRKLSRALATMPTQELTPGELARLHDAIADAADAPILRLGAVIGTIAASILVVSATWLATLPTPETGRPVTGSVVARGPAPAWEQAALSLRVEPPHAGGQRGGDHGGDQDHVYFADAKLDEWMLDGLNRSAQR